MLSESDFRLANQTAYKCFKLIGIKMDESDLSDIRVKSDWKLVKPRFYNGSPLIEVSTVMHHVYQNALKVHSSNYNFRAKHSTKWMPFVDRRKSILFTLIIIKANHHF